MNFNKLTEKAREAVAKAIELAKQANNPQVEPEHLLVALIEQEGGLVPRILQRLGFQAGPVTMLPSNELTCTFLSSEWGSCRHPLKLDFAGPRPCWRSSPCCAPG